MVALQVQQHHLRSLTAKFAVWFMPEGGALREELARLGQVFPDCVHAVTSSPFKGKFQETLLVYPRNSGITRLAVVGVGTPVKLTPERLRRAATTAVRLAETHKAVEVTLLEPAAFAGSGPDHEPASVAHALLEGAALAVYRYDAYRTRDRKSSPPVSHIGLVTSATSRLPALQRVLKEVRTVVEGTWLARDLENAPGNEIYPETLAREAAAAGRRAGFSVKVFRTAKLRQLGMGGILGVSSGSVKAPRLVVMEYRRGRTTTAPVVLVGKGVTFDSGGISIKPSANMAEMKMDMSGAAAVIGAMQTIARMRLPVHVVGIVPASENMPSGSALRPGDIITHYNGLTTEVENTDAEGRLILADALSYAARFRPSLIIDLATLTGAVVVALGHVASGMMGNDQEAMDALKAAGERTGERVWQLPMFEEYEKLIRSDVADVKNLGGRWAGAITGAMFLKQFVGDHRWVHLDIAGTAIMEEAFEYIPKGGSGVGVRLLVDFLRNRGSRNGG
jgi:leucyl aminopeptidase